jgi:hypothetical protein
MRPTDKGFFRSLIALVPFRGKTLAVAAVLVAATAAHAQDFDAATHHFATAQEEFGKQHYKIAAGEFQAAFDISKDPMLLFNIGEAWHKAGEGQKAVDAYKAYLGAKPDATDKAEVQKRIKAITANHMKLPSESAPDDDPAAFAAAQARAAEDKAAADKEAAEKAAADKTAADKAAAERAAAERAAAEKAAAEAAAKPLPVAAAPPPAALQPPASTMRIVAWAGVAMTVAVLTAGAIMGLAAQSRADEIERREKFVDANGQPKTFDSQQQSDFKNLTNEGNTYNAAAISLYTISAALAVTTTVLFVLDYKRTPAKRDVLSIGPSIDKNGAGVFASVRF